MQKVLLLTDIPPCSNFTAGLVLDRLVRFLPLKKIAICAVVNPSLKPNIPKDLGKIPTLILKKPFEGSGLIFPRLKTIVSFVLENIQSFYVKYYLLPKIITFIKQQQIDIIWVVLQGQTMIRLADHLAQQTNLPLFTQIWDPFEWWLRANQIDRFTKQKLLKTFDKVIKSSISCATASWNMSDNYSRLYRIDNLPVIAGLPVQLAKSAATHPRPREEFIITMAGQFYAQVEWNSLINALNHVRWCIGEKTIRIRVLGGTFQYHAQLPVNFEYLGWRSQEDTISLLAESDLLYMPYWFSEEFRLEAANSFPSKLVSYFAAGRPVFCHAPKYSSPAQYIAQNDAGYLCHSLELDTILEVLQYVISDSESYAKFARNGAKCFARDFTLETMKTSFLKFLKFN